MREITSLAQAEYCPDQRTVSASDSSGAAVQRGMLPPGGEDSDRDGLGMLSSVFLQKIETMRMGVQGVEF
jgi:hypothetical protein